MFFCAVCSVRVIGESDIMQEFLSDSDEVSTKRASSCLYLPVLSPESVSSADNPELQRRVRCGAENSHARQDCTHRPSSQKCHHGPGLSGKHPPPPWPWSRQGCRCSQVGFSLSLPLLQAVVMKLGMDSVTSSYFALFEVINHTFGLYNSVIFQCFCHVILQQLARTRMVSVGVINVQVSWFITPNMSYSFPPLFLL